MFLKRSSKLVVLLFLLFFAYLVFGYDNIVIHPKITGQAILLYNKNADRKIAPEQVSWIIDGAVAEDTDPRYLNHYYNPVNGQGLSGWDELYGVPIKVSGMPAKQWAKNQDSATGDYSVSAIFNNYREGNLKRAYQGVGHILHLIQDMAVPAHTRNDSHAMGDPYEEWAEQYGTISLDKTKYIEVDSINDVFDNLANYSNNNFYSKDTINFNIKNNYSIKDEIIDGKKRRYFLNKINGVEYRLIYSKNPDSIIPVYQVDDDFKVNLDYWNMLYPQAVGYSAGVIDYFVKEFEKIDEEKSKMSFWDKISIAVSKTLDTKESDKYHWGDIFLASRNAIADGWHNFTGATGQAYDFSKLVVESGGEVINNTAKKSIEAAKDAGGKVLSAIENPISADDLFAPQKAKSAEDNGAFAGQPEQEKVKVLSSEYSEDQGRLKANSLSQQDVGKIGVSYVIDGDTIVLTTGEKVRYIGIDTPELNNDGAQDDECLAWVARIRNTELLSAGELKLVKDSAVDKDKYGRLLRYVYAGNVFINKQLALEGLATEFFCRSGWDNCQVTADKTRESEIKAAANSAEQNKRGLFSGVCEQEKMKKENNKETAMEQTNGKNSTNNSNKPSEKKKSSSNKQTTTFIPGGNSSPAAPQSLTAQEEEQAGVGGEEQSSEQLENGQSEDEDSQSSSNAASSSIVLDIIAPMEIIKTADDHAVISEIRIDGEEFMELYNPVDNDVDMTGWHWCYYSSGRDWNNPYRIKPFSNNAIIKSKGYYLIAIVNGELSGADWNLDYTSHFLSNTAGSIAIFPFDPAEKTAQEAENGKIDAVGWGNVSYVKESNPSIAPNINQSIERKAFATSTAELMSNDGDHEWLGNAYDTDNNLNDFIIRLAPDAQNFSSQTEPYEKPLIRPDKISDLTIQRIYTKGKSIKLYWTSPDSVSLSEGAYYDMRYKEKNGAECDIGADWDNAYQVSTSTLPAPFSASGIINTKKITGLQIDTDYCFAVKTFNGEAWSDISNIASGKTLPAFLACSEIPIDADGGILISELTADSSPYCVNNRFFRNRFFKIKAGNKLIVEPGVVIKFQSNTGLIVEGELIAEGSLGQPISFTSYNDNEKQGAYGIETPAAGDWGAIRVVNGGKLTMDNVIVNYGGNYQTGDFFIAMMMIAWLDAGAIVVENGEVNIVNSIISHNTIGAEINGDNSVVNITNSQIFSNQSGGIINYASSTVNAVNNWWGDNSGPYHETLNPNGLGDSVSGNILFDPWIGK